jgi:dUTP pyrophosphatase
MKIKVKKLHEDAVIPKYAHRGDSGFDFHAIEDVIIRLGETELIRTGLAISVGDGYELQARPRSGLSLKTGLRINNSPGTIDSSYSGEISIIMSLVSDGHGTISYTIKKGDRIAQGVICPVVRADIEVVDELSETVRGSGAFGSTGSGAV